MGAEKNFFPSIGSKYNSCHSPNSGEFCSGGGGGGRAKTEVYIGKTRVRGAVSATDIENAVTKGPLTLKIAGRGLVTFERSGGTIYSSGRQGGPVSAHQIAKVINDATGFS